MTQRDNSPGPWIIRNKATGHYLVNCATGQSGPKWSTKRQDAWIFRSRNRIHNAAYAVRKFSNREFNYETISIAESQEPEVLTVAIETPRQPQPTPPPPVIVRAPAPDVPNEMVGDALGKVIALLQEEATACEMYFQIKSRRISAETTYRFLSGHTA